MKVQGFFTKQHIQSNGVLKPLQNSLSLSSLAEALEAGLIGYEFADVQINHTTKRMVTFAKLEVRTTHDFCNDVYFGFNAGKCNRLLLFSALLFKENGTFRLERINIGNECIFTFNYRVTRHILQCFTDKTQLDSLVAKLMNDMCKVCIDSTLAGGYDIKMIDTYGIKMIDTID